MRRAFVSIGLLLLCCSPAFASTSPDLESFLQSLNSSGSCPTPIQTCIEGSFDWRAAGCCPYGQQQYFVYECIDGTWVLTGTSCDGSCF